MISKAISLYRIEKTITSKIIKHSQNRHWYPDYRTEI